ncbi:UDP-glucose 4-epimerase GalE [Starkeya koreensis]|uniref:UDP-glucose 4-epimerase n=1 Tax=Ancylobacter koreensis TaxID=266121 RepID=A0ABT0DLC5_9HYPH|nr:UDP-glucose 4-epimerase GalE [Ancylobacter koreensis]
MSGHILVTGGAGYVGSHACKALMRAGYVPVTLDNLVTGRQDAVLYGPFEFGDLADRARLDEVFARWQPQAVMHFAAFSEVGESVRDPGKYWRANVVGALNLIEAALDSGCRRFIFSSTCSVYGDRDGVSLDEDTPTSPTNAYGASKRTIEEMLEQFERSHGLSSVIFRYFNVAGADPEGEIRERHDPETHLIPIVLEVAAGTRPHVQMFGQDYPTPDGTCVRDFIHVSDLADAHVLGLRRLERGEPGAVFCLGSGNGFSVREVVDAARRVTGCTIPALISGRRPGDAARLVAGSSKARRELDWEPTRSDLDTMIADAWNALTKAG